MCIYVLRVFESSFYFESLYISEEPRGVCVLAIHVIFLHCQLRALEIGFVRHVKLLAPITMEENNIEQRMSIFGAWVT